MEDNLVIFLPFDVEGDTEFSYASATNHTATWRENLDEKTGLNPPKKTFTT